MLIFRKPLGGNETLRCERAEITWFWMCVYHACVTNRCECCLSLLLPLRRPRPSYNSLCIIVVAHNVFHFRAKRKEREERKNYLVIISIILCKGDRIISKILDINRLIPSVATHLFLCVLWKSFKLPWFSHRMSYYMVTLALTHTWSTQELWFVRRRMT